MKAICGRRRLPQFPALVTGLSGAIAVSLAAAAPAAAAGQPRAEPSGPRLPAGPGTIQPPPTGADGPGRIPPGLGPRPPILAPAVAAPPACPTGTSFPSVIRNAGLVHIFPEVAWQICVRDMIGRTVWVGPVWMMDPATGTWELVLDQAGLADMFFVTHDGLVRDYGLGAAGSVGPQEAGANGIVLQLQDALDPQPTARTVIAELRERGIAWLCKQTTAATRRSWELVIWGYSDRGYHDTIVEYAFRDDGAITFRVGHAGYNRPADPTEPHTHDALWYVHPGGPRQAHWLTHVEPSGTLTPAAAQDVETAIPLEGGRQWVEYQVTSLLITGNALNGFGNRRGYEVSPLPNNALSRHFGPLDGWTQNDVYLTRADHASLGWVVSGASPDHYLMQGLDGESIVDEDIAFWIRSSAHHVPTDEDRSSADWGGGMTGTTLIRWSGFRMEPHNLFNANPLGGPARCGP